MLPGKTYTPEEIILIVRRRIWLILVPFAIVSATAAVVARMLPDLYVSEATILVVPQKVPESFVRPTVTTGIQDQLLAIAETVLSRSKLEQLIQELNLYEEERRSGAIMQDLVERMKWQDIQTRVEKGDVFRVSYIGSNPRLVKDVTERLASFFISENLRNRDNLAQGTSQFLEGQLEDARKSLLAQEDKIKEFQRKYAGELPAQMESNLQQARSYEMQIQSLEESINDDRDLRLTYEKTIADIDTEIEEAPVASVAAGSPAPAGAPPVGPAAQQLAAARLQLEALEKTAGAGHPNMKRAREQIAVLEKAAKAEADLAAAGQPATAGGARPTMSASLNPRQRRLEQARLELAQLDSKIAKNEDALKKLRGAVDNYMRRVAAVPGHEAELLDLRRGYEVSKQLYDSRLRNLEDARTAANLERRQIGQQFTMLEQARVPERPFSPDRMRYNMMGLLAGLGCGLALVVLVEYRDKSFKGDDEVVRMLSLPVLAVVPLMQSAGEKRRALRTQLLMGIGFGTLVAGCLAVVLYTMVR